ncbi:MAG: ECF transporter S component [Hominicoprocola sp.]
MSEQAKRTHRLAVAAVLSAVAAVLQFLEIPLPFLIPDFVRLDFSELPALLASFSMGPLWGAAVCLIKNLFKLTTSYSGGVGELGNFLLGVCFVIPAGVFYKRHKTRRGALLASVIGSMCMALASIPINYYITYPVYANIFPIEVILSLYQAIRPSVNGLLECLCVFNAPFTLLKGTLDVLLCFLIYKPLSPLLHK